MAVVSWASARERSRVMWRVTAVYGVGGLEIGQMEMVSSWMLALVFPLIFCAIHTTHKTAVFFPTFHTRQHNQTLLVWAWTLDILDQLQRSWRICLTAVTRALVPTQKTHFGGTLKTSEFAHAAKIEIQSFAIGAKCARAAQFTHETVSASILIHITCLETLSP